MFKATRHTLIIIPRIMIPNNDDSQEINFPNVVECSITFGGALLRGKYFFSQCNNNNPSLPTEKYTNERIKIPLKTLTMNS